MSKKLRSERGSIDTWIALAIALLILIPSSYAMAEVVQAARIRTVLQQGADMVAQAQTASGGYTDDVQKALSNYLTENGLLPGKVYISATPGQQGYGQNNMSVVLGYDYNVAFPGTRWNIWHTYVQSSTSQIQSDYVPGAINATISSPDGFAGVQGGEGSPGPAPMPSPVTVVNNLTISLNPAHALAGQAITVSGRALEGSIPPPAGTMVNISVSGTNINTSACTNSSGAFSASFKINSAGTFTVTASCGVATASQQFTTVPGSASRILLTYPQSVTVGRNMEIIGQVTDAFGNPVSDSSLIDVASNDAQDIPGRILPTTGGSFQLAVGQVAMSPLCSPLTVTFSSGSASSAASIAIVNGPPQKVTLNAASTSITAGKKVIFSGRVSSVANTPVAQGTDVGLNDGSGMQDAFPLTVRTDRGGNFTAGPVAITCAGLETVVAAVTENGSTVCSQVRINVAPASPAIVEGLTVNPDPVFQGANATVTGTVTDRYGNPVPGASVTLLSGAFNRPYTAVTAHDGTFNQSVVFTAPGTQTISVAYGKNLLSPGGVEINVLEQGAYTVTPGPASRNVTAGQTAVVSFVVTDASGGPATGVPVTISASPSAGTSLSATLLTTDESGEVSVQVTPDASGTVSVTASLAGCGGTAKLNVSPAAPCQIPSIQITPSFIQVKAPPGDWPVVSGEVLDRWGNPVPGADITVSGGYGANAAGVSGATGMFNVSIDPANVGGPFALTVRARDSLGSVTARSGTGLTVVKYPPATVHISLVNPGQAIYTGQLIPVYCTLYNQNMQLWSDATVEFVTVTDQTAQILNLTPSGPAGSGTGFLQQATGTYGSGEAAVNVNFDQSGSQTMLAELYINGNFTGACAALTVTVLPGTVSQIMWNPVLPCTTVPAGTTLTVSGVALNSLGNPVPDGTQILVQLPGSNAQPQTVYTTTSGGQLGRFCASLTPVTEGSWQIQALAGAQTFTYGNPSPELVMSGTPACISIWGQTVYHAIPLGDASAGFGFSVFDAYGNMCPNVQLHVSFKASNGGVVPTPVNQPPPTNAYGQTGTYEGPYNHAGDYTIIASYGSASASARFSVTANAPMAYSVTNLQAHYDGKTCNLSERPITIPAGTPVTVTGTISDQFGHPTYGIINLSFFGGSSGLNQFSSDASGNFSGTVTPYTAGSENLGVVLNSSAGSPARIQPAVITPGPASNINVYLNPQTVGINNCPSPWGGFFNVIVVATDSYNNLVPSATATISTTSTSSSVEAGMPATINISGGVGEISNLSIQQAGTWPITVTVGNIKKTVYLHVI